MMTQHHKVRKEEFDMARCLGHMTGAIGFVNVSSGLWEIVWPEGEEPTFYNEFDRLWVYATSPQLTDLGLAEMCDADLSAGFWNR